MKKFVFCIAFFVSVFTFFSCEKNEGYGGNATITGRVIMQQAERIQNTVLAEFGAREERVYIIFGDNEIYDDDVRTNHDGQYQFKFLYPGKYRIYAYTECRACPEETFAEFVEVEVGEKDKEVLAPDLVIVNY